MSLSANMRIPQVFAGLVLAYTNGANAFANEGAYHQLKGESLKAAFMETTVFSEYQRIGGGIQNDHFTETHHANGDTDYQEYGTPLIKGSWQIIGDDKICYKYPDNKIFTQTYCFFVFKSGSCYYNYGASEMTLSGPRSWDFWTSRFVRKGEGGSCAKPIS